MSDSPRVSRVDALVYGLAVLAGAALVFQIQPIAGKLLLPSFGGGASIWTACMFFFQSMLLAGYGYAHLLTRLRSPRMQAAVHAGLLILSVAFMPITIAAEGTAGGAGNPGGVILLTLLVTTGVPFMMLASTAPLIQRWSSLTRPGRSPYRLYALSNAGALLALVTYPFVIEPNLSLRTQTIAWSGGYALFLVASLAACRLVWQRHGPGYRKASLEPALSDGTGTYTAFDGLFTVVLSACGVVALLAVTNQITRNVAPVPFLWIAPLVTYLLTYIVCFSGERWYDRSIWGSLFIVSATTLIILDYFGSSFPLLPAVAAWLLVLFCLCMICHGELYRLRPEPRQLSVYYLLIAFGGAMGGALVSLVAPAVFTRYWEGLVAAYLIYLVFGVLVLRAGRKRRREAATQRTPPLQLAIDRWSLRLFTGGWVIGILAFPAIVAALDTLRPSYDVASTRNFYGVLNVRDVTNDEPKRRVLIDGTTIHGFQLLDESMSDVPTSYYGRGTGIAVVMNHLDNRRSVRVGVVGLGTGTMAAYGKASDEYRFYELNPAVVDLAKTHFSFLRESPASIDIVLGDGRISLERELRQDGGRNFDLLVIDAFNSDAIPVHLLTLEALHTYLAHLRPGGILAFHVTNSYLDLSPVVADLARVVGKKALLASTVVDTGVSSRSDWALLVDRDTVLIEDAVKGPLVQGPIGTPVGAPPEARVWTDDYSDLLGTLKP